VPSESAKVPYVKRVERRKGGEGRGEKSSAGIANVVVAQIEVA